MNTTHAAPADMGEPLCAAADIEERGRAWVWDVLEHGRPVRAFALRFDGQLRGYLNRCVHVAAEMDWQPGEFLDADRRWILCAIHGAAYEPASGRLTPVGVGERDGQVYWYPSRDIRPAPSEAPASESPP